MILKWVMIIIFEVIQSSTHNLPLLLGPQGSARRRNGRDHNSVMGGALGPHSLKGPQLASSTGALPKGPTACLFYWGPP